MSAYGIYQKPCPACGVLVSTGTPRCDCGYAFESAGDEALLPEERALQEEELFEAYLAARIEQMIAALDTARAGLTVDPDNSRKFARLVQTVQEALQLREERDAQAAKTGQARQAAMEARAKISPPTAESWTAAPAAPDVPVQSAEPTDAFRAQQAAKAAKVMEAFADTQTRECPHCKTVLPVTSALCLCGYIFARNEFMLPRGVDTTLRAESPPSKQT